MLLRRGVEPFATWYYNFAWYPVLLVADGVVALVGGAGNGRRGEFLLLGRKSFLLTVLAWSAVVWLFYEMFNFRLQNWYYVNLPPDRLNRWAGTVVAFATVLPAVFVAEGILNGLNVAKQVRWPSFAVSSAVINGMRIAGVIMLALVLIWPRYFFPLVWGATMLLIEPENYKRSPAHSLLGDLAQGKPGRLLRLLLGGALIGFTWEMLNINARAKWIYTVPGVEELKIFEMPVPGFLGFPPFAVECFILWQALVLSGLGVPRIGVPANQLSKAGYDAFLLAHEEPAEIARITATDELVAAAWIEEARLATLRGIGSEHLALLHQLGINTLTDLAAQDSRRLIASLEQLTGRDFVAARVRVWIRGARRTLEKQRAVA